MMLAPVPVNANRTSIAKLHSHLGFTVQIKIGEDLFSTDRRQLSCELVRQPYGHGHEIFRVVASITKDVHLIFGRNPFNFFIRETSLIEAVGFL